MPTPCGPLFPAKTKNPRRRRAPIAAAAALSRSRPRSPKRIRSRHFPINRRRSAPAITRHNRDLQQLRQQMAQDSANYFGLVGQINSRLQVGTTPGNPQLIAQWNQAQGALDKMNDDIAKLNSLSNQAASDSSLAAYILESVKAAYGLQGAVDEDHRQLTQLENEVNRTVVLIDRLLNALSDDISRQSSYVSNERNNLVTLSVAIKNGELYGQSLANRAFSSAAPLSPAAPTAGRSSSSASTSPMSPMSRRSIPR